MHQWSQNVEHFKYECSINNNILITNPSYFYNCVQVIELTFDLFDVEGDELNCRYDALIVHDGPNSSAPVLGYYCGNQGPSPVTSSQHEMTLIFKSDSSVQRSGFSVSYIEREQSCQYTFFMFYFLLS